MTNVCGPRVAPPRCPPSPWSPGCASPCPPPCPPCPPPWPACPPDSMVICHEPTKLAASCEATCSASTESSTNVAQTLPNPNRIFLFSYITQPPGDPGVPYSVGRTNTQNVFNGGPRRVPHFFWRARLGRRDIDYPRDIDYASVNLN